MHERILRLVEDPRPAGAHKLTGVLWNRHPVYRIRSGDYRVLYSLTREREILIIRIGHRQGVYRGMT